jgi:arachidonate 15-lipoxygenase
MAKMFVQAADLNLNQAVNHLGETHLTEEAFAIAMHRQLAVEHPLYILLSFHFAALIVINKLGELTLLNKAGLIQNILEGGLSGSLELIQNAYAGWDFNDFDFPVRTAKRGLDPVSLPYFPYRDDGQLIWDTLGSYVDDYIALYYKTDKDVTGDYELQNWATDLRTACSLASTVRGTGNR